MQKSKLRRGKNHEHFRKEIAITQMLTHPNVVSVCKIMYHLDLTKHAIAAALIIVFVTCDHASTTTHDQMYEFMQSPDQCFIVLEFVPGGSLDDLLAEKGCQPTRQNHTIQFACTRYNSALPAHALSNQPRGSTREHQHILAIRNFERASS